MIMKDSPTKPTTVEPKPQPSEGTPPPSEGFSPAKLLPECYLILKPNRRVPISLELALIYKSKWRNGSKPNTVVKLIIPNDNG
jgi:hypothetical protein